MRILFCLDYYYPHVGGAEILFQNVAEGLVRLGHQVDVVTQRVEGTEAFCEHNGVRIHRVRTFGMRHFFAFLAVPKMLDLAKKADLIHTSTFAAAPPAWLAARLRGKKVIITVHEVWVGKWSRVSDAGRISNIINDLAERMLYWFNYDKYVAVSNATSADLRGLLSRKAEVHTIYNGVDYGHWCTEKHNGDELRRKLAFEDKFVFLFTGRPGRSKGLPVLLKAFASVENCDYARLLVLASRSKACRRGFLDAIALVEKLGISDRVIFMDSVSYEELPDVVSAADCVCVPSLSEGFGFCAAEACAMGKPVIATDNASLPEVVGGRFILVPPGEPEAFASGMRRALAGKYDFRPCPIFTNEANISGHIALYSKVCVERDMP